MHPVIQYIKFLFRSTNQHGVHSPFVYRFVTLCLYNKSNDEAYKKLNKYRKSLLKSNTSLEVLDLGEGSKKLKKHKRKTSVMARTSSSTKKNTRILYRVSKYFGARKILELGTSLGMATYAFALADRNSKITTIEGCPNTLNFTKNRFEKLEIKNTKFMSGDFESVIPTFKDRKFDIIFFDGHHNKAATLHYFEALLSKAHNESVFIFDDIYWSKGMTEAWQCIKEHKAVTVTVDCFHLGFVFFRKEQAKEHFKIRV